MAQFIHFEAEEEEGYENEQDMDCGEDVGDFIVNDDDILTCEPYYSNPYLGHTPGVAGRCR